MRRKPTLAFLRPDFPLDDAGGVAHGGGGGLGADGKKKAAAPKCVWLLVGWLGVLGLYVCRFDDGEHHGSLHTSQNLVSHPHTHHYHVHTTHRLNAVAKLAEADRRKAKARKAQQAAAAEGGGGDASSASGSEAEGGQAPERAQRGRKKVEVVKKEGKGSITGFFAPAAAKASKARANEAVLSEAESDDGEQ